MSDPLARIILAAAVAATLAAPAPAAAAPTGAADDPTAALLLDYQAAQAFRERVRASFLLVRVETAVLPGCDPDFRPVIQGAAAVVRPRDGAPPVILTAAPLVRDAHRVTLVAAPDRTSPARVVRTLADPGVAVIAPLDPDALGPLRPLAAATADDTLAPGRPVLTLENLASGLEVLLRGQVVEPGPAPLVDLRVVSIEVGAGEPLLDVHGHFAGLCFRHLTATDRRCFASRAPDILAALTAAPPPTKARAAGRGRP